MGRHCLRHLYCYICCFPIPWNDFRYWKNTGCHVISWSSERKGQWHTQYRRQGFCDFHRFLWPFWCDILLVGKEWRTSWKSLKTFLYMHLVSRSHGSIDLIYIVCVCSLFCKYVDSTFYEINRLWERWSIYDMHLLLSYKPYLYVRRDVKFK